MSRWSIMLGDSRERLRELGDATVDAVVTDPPYEIAFMGRGWDASGIAYDVGLWREALRVLKPGGHLLAFGATRTYHRLAVAIENAGFEIRDSLHWLYGSGFPKSLDVSKAIDKAAGATREVIGRHPLPARNKAGGASYNMSVNGMPSVVPITAPATDDARTWQGWGTALKPAHEPIVVARKPLAGTVAANVLEHGVGGINIDGCRVAHSSAADFKKHADGVAAIKARGGSMANSWKNSSDLSGANDVSTAGRWPPNAIFAHLPACSPEACVDGCAVAELDAQSGGASRFFPVFRYQSKASRRERGLAVAHPTVKPIELMRWCIRLVTPKGGTVLDPFTGSGTTGVAAMLEDARFVGVELSPEYRKIAVARVEAALAGIAGEQLDLFELEESAE